MWFGGVILWSSRLDPGLVDDFIFCCLMFECYTFDNDWCRDYKGNILLYEIYSEISYNISVGISTVVPII